MKTQYDIDMTAYGPITDNTGDMEQCFKNLRNLLIELHCDHSAFTPRTRVLVMKSWLKWDHGTPYRTETTLIRRVSTLLKEYAEWYFENKAQGEPFDLEKAASRIEAEGYASWKEGQRNAAWGPYVYTVRVSKAIKEASEILKEKDRPQEKIRKLKEAGIYYIVQPHLSL